MFSLLSSITGEIEMSFRWSESFDRVWLLLILQESPGPAFCGNRFPPSSPRLETRRRKNRREEIIHRSVK